jgi:hypothetical protein
MGAQGVFEFGMGRRFGGHDHKDATTLCTRQERKEVFENRNVAFPPRENDKGKCRA